MTKTVYQHIEINPKIMLGKPVIKGTRIAVSLVLNLLANNYTTEKIIKAYPELTTKDIQACLAFAAQFLNLQEEKELSITTYD
ncbi:MAG: hypothetical protein ACD_12C00436G0004 [uncultured bacterium]|nr:MAG: hypothetical protein ACD_12C00436G0004 [uncultured bacterium]